MSDLLKHIETAAFVIVFIGFQYFEYNYHFSIVLPEQCVVTFYENLFRFQPVNSHLTQYRALFDIVHTGANLLKLESE